MYIESTEHVNQTLPKAVDLVAWFNDLTRADIAIVGGKTASLGELITRLQGVGIRVPNGFATTATAYWLLLGTNDLTAPVSRKLAGAISRQLASCTADDSQR